MPPECLVLELGLVPYIQAWQLQNDLAARISTGDHPPVLLLLEHPHTYTFGRRGQAKHLIWNDAELHRRGITVHWVDRGGDVTYHGPGQLVGYPLLQLATARAQVETGGEPGRIPQADYIGYLRKLEQVLIGALDRLGVPAFQVEGKTGVWVKREQAICNSSPDFPANQDIALAEECRPLIIGGFAKIASIGVKVDARGITRHGFSLNITPDMSYWQGIIACGLEGAWITSLAELLVTPPCKQDVMSAVIQAFGEIFNYQMVSPAETKHTLSG